MGNKTVFKLAGIAEVLGGRLKDEGFDQVLSMGKLQCMLLMLNSRNQFQEQKKISQYSFNKKTFALSLEKLSVPAHTPQYYNTLSYNKSTLILQCRNVLSVLFLTRV